MTGTQDATTDREIVLRTLSRARPRSRFVRASTAALLLLTVYAWGAGDFRVGDFASARRLVNVERFAGELKPYPLQGRRWDSGIALEWIRALMTARGWQAAAATLAISVAAIALAGLAALVLSLPATRSVAAPESYLPHSRVPSRFARMTWTALVWITRAFLIFLRAIPEYVWAFLLIAVIGPTAWAAVLALAIHNSGILGKLNAEVIENLDPAPLAGLRALGAQRRQIALVGILPSILPRFLLLFFYRWETCVREATVLGMLGIVSLGYYIQDARARQHYDDMGALILLGAVIVIVGDLVSAAAREAVRRSR